MSGQHLLEVPAETKEQPCQTQSSQVNSLRRELSADKVELVEYETVRQPNSRSPQARTGDEGKNGQNNLSRADTLSRALKGPEENKPGSKLIARYLIVDRFVMQQRKNFFNFITNRVMCIYDTGIEIFTLTKKEQDQGREYYYFSDRVLIQPTEGRRAVANCRKVGRVFV